MPFLASLGGGSAFGFGRGRGGGRSFLYDFNAHTFTPAGAIHATGPTYAQTQSSYNLTINPWLSNTAYFTVPTNGFQRMVIPETGTYRIEAAGACGAWSPATSGPYHGGNGGIITGEFVFTQGEELFFVVGQTGESDLNGANSPRIGGFNGGGGGQYNAGGGSGGSDVRLGGTALSNRIIVAGGGGGGSHGTPGGAGGYPNGTNGTGTTGGTATSGNALGVGGTSNATCNGGGGGGYWGGTAASPHGSTGGGGSSWLNTALGSLVSHTTGGRSDTGYITITRIS
jgi:hypothetical protein